MNKLKSLLSDERKYSKLERHELEGYLINDSISISDICHLVTLLKDRLQCWSKSSGGSKDKNGLIALMLCQAIFTVIFRNSTQQQQSLLTDDQFKALVYTMSYSLKMAEFNDNLQLIHAFYKCLVHAQSNFSLIQSWSKSEHVARLTVHSIQNFSQILSNAPQDWGYKEADLLFEVMKLIASAETAKLLELVLTNEQSIKVHQFSIEVSISFCLRNDILNGDLASKASAAFSSLMICLAIRVYDIQDSKVIELIIRSLSSLKKENTALPIILGSLKAYLASIQQKVKSNTPITTDLFRLILMSLEVSTKNENLANEFSQILSEAVVCMTNKPSDQFKDPSICVISRQYLNICECIEQSIDEKLCSELKHMYEAIDDLISQFDRITLLDLLCRIPRLLANSCFSKEGDRKNERWEEMVCCAIDVSIGVIKKLLSLTIALPLSRSTPTSDSELKVINQIVSVCGKHFSVLMQSILQNCKQLKAGSRPSIAFAVAKVVSIEILHVLATSDIWTYNKSILISLLKSAGNILMTISVDSNVTWIEDDRIIGMFNSIELLCEKFHIESEVCSHQEHQTLKFPQLLEFTGCAMTLATFLIPRAILKDICIPAMTMSSALMKCLGNVLDREHSQGQDFEKPSNTTATDPLMSSDSIFKYLSVDAYCKANAFASALFRYSDESQACIDRIGLTIKSVPKTLFLYTTHAFFLEANMLFQDGKLPPNCLKQSSANTRSFDEIISQLAGYLSNTQFSSFDCGVLIAELSCSTAAVEKNSPNNLLAQVTSLQKMNEKVGKTPASSSLGDAASNGSEAVSSTNILPTLAIKIKMWLLMARLLQPNLTTARDDFGSSANFTDVNAYISNALKALKEFGEKCNKTLEAASVSRRKTIIGVELNNPIASATASIQDIRYLFYLLGIHGRISDQVRVLQISEGIIKNLAEIRVDSDFKALIEELKIACAVQHVLIGEYAWMHAQTAKKAAASHPHNDVGSFLTALLKSQGGSEWLHELLSGVQCCHQLLEHRSMSNYDSGSRSSTNPTLSNHQSLDNVTEFKSFVSQHILKHLEFSTSSRLKPSHNTSNRILLRSLTLLRVWLHLLAAKVSLLVYGCHQSSIAYCRKVISFTAQGGLQRIAWDTTLPRIEAILLMAEIHEQCGLVEGTLTYLSEAIAASKVASKACMGLVALHGLRVWYRLSSSRVISNISDLVTLNEFSDEESYDEVSKGIRCIISLLTLMMGISVDDDVILPGASYDQYAAHIPLPKKMKFRHMDCYWDIRCISGNGSRKNVVSCAYHTCMSSSLRAQLSARINTATELVNRKSDRDSKYIPILGVLKPSPDCSIDLAKTNSPNASNEYCNISNSTIEYLSGCLNFDIIRDLRRHSCYLGSIGAEFVGHQLPATYPILSSCLQNFILGASSCAVSTELSTLLDPTTSSETSSFSSVFQEMSHSHRLISDTLSSQQTQVAFDALSEIDSRLQSLLRLPVRTSSHESSALSPDFAHLRICFGAVDPFTRHLLIGRYDHHCVLVMALPIVEPLDAFLSDWKQLMEDNQQTLRQTSDPDLVRKWTDREKMKWWDNRKASDLKTSELLERFESLLGPWFILFAGKFLPESRCRELNLMAVLQEAVRPSQMDDIEAALHEMDIQPSFSQYHSKSAAEAAFPHVLSTGAGRDAALVAILSLILGSLDMLTSAETLPFGHQRTTTVVQMIVDVLKQGSGRLRTSDEELLDVANKLVAMVRQSPSTSSAESSSSTKASDIETPFASMEKLKITELRKRLKDAGLSTVGKKEELINRLIESGATGSIASADNMNNDSPPATSERDHVVLILDENLQGVPIECMPSLRGKSCSRVPGLAMLLSMAAARSSAIGKTTHDVKKSWFVVDPESNLTDTKTTMTTFLDPYVQRWGWKGFVSEMPPEDLVRTHHDQAELFIYSGHGAGDKFINSYKLRKHRSPSALLWGCSSGKLRIQGWHDPSGSAINYLLGGAQFVVGNLWDVTDRDIDNYSMNCMAKVLPGCHAEKSSEEVVPLLTLAEGVSQSRSVCKLQHIVGTAPVMYGLPTMLTEIDIDSCK